MLLKTSSSDKNSSFLSNNGKGKGKARSTVSRIHRKTLRIASKPSSSSAGKRVPIGKRISSLGKSQKNIYASFHPSTSSSICDNSNDSGLGFDHHESQQNLMPSSGGKISSNNVNYSSSHRSLNSIRYGEISAQAASAYAPPRKQTGLGVGKKIKSISHKTHSIAKSTSSSSSSSSSNHMTLKNETEDTCGDDFFSNHIQKSNEKSNTISSPTKIASYSNGGSSEKGSSSSSSPLTLSCSSDRSSPEISNDDNKLTETTDEVTTSSSLTLQNQNLTAVSRNGCVQLQIVTQPEQQHRARYQTEGSRGAVKDKSGNGFPVVRLNGYKKPATLQVFIGNDVGRVSPHIFYQACKVSGKNSTTCNEVKVEGTMIIEIEIKPENDMTVVCDCVGILKERNVDVEHRLGKNNSLAAATVTRNKKKSTKCRMIFRTKINEDTDCPEVLQICSNTITCTQPPGIPEICKKSLETCSVSGGKELFIIGKNFLKDTKVTFARYEETRQQQPKKVWEETVQPDKEYLQQTHLICTVPAYPNADDVTEPIHVQIYVTSSSKKSEPHNFIYTPLKKYRPISHSPTIDLGANIVFATKNSPDSSVSPTQLQNVLQLNWNDGACVSPENIMPPPPSMSRKASFSKNSPDTSQVDPSSIVLKTEYIDPVSCAVSSSDLHQEVSASTSPTSNIVSGSTSSPASSGTGAGAIQPTNAPPSSSSSASSASSSSSVKELIFNDNAIIAQCFVGPNTPSLIGGPAVAAAPTTSQVEQALLSDFQVSASSALDLHHIKSEQSADLQPQIIADSTVNAMLPPIAPSTSAQPDLSSVQQQQVVENFLNMICAQVEPAGITTQAPDIISHPHLHPDLIHHDLAASNAVANNAGSANVSNGSSAQSDRAANMCAISTQSPMMCEQNLLAAVQTNIIPMSTLDSAIESSSGSANASLISNAVSDATAETQAVVKQMIATVTAELLSENPVETQSTITNFISSTLVNDMVQAVSTEQAQQAQQQITDSQQQQLQEIIAQELLTPVMIKKEENNGQVQSIQENLINAVSTTINPSASNITQPFSPTSADFNLTSMSESDLISFINPSVFM